MNIRVIVILVLVIIRLISLFSIDILAGIGGKSEKENTTHEKDKSDLHDRSGE